MTAAEEEELARAIRQARAAGVPWNELDRAIRRETELDDELSPVLIPARLRALAQKAGSRA